MQRVLVIGRSPGVILDTVEILRGRGFQADATNQFDDVMVEYDTVGLDIVVFGGMVPAATKQHLRDEISKVNDRVTFVQGLGGIAGLIAAQVEGAASAAGDDGAVAYDAARRSVRLTLAEPARVVVDAWWGTSFTPPEPASTSLRVTDAGFDAGAHVIALPAEVPDVASFVTVSAGAVVRAFTVGAMPEAVTRLVPTGDPARPSALPPVRPVSTHSTTTSERVHRP
ncbi:hypothetical protein [Dactylosporangium sp. CA-139066]|uniref:hypothetical protein n=1 Tax=Dactylosporangium sp. CA-139066 TaxID=3239930 RepID=UPI003D8FA445